MAFSVIMPKAGMAMETGTILRWLKKPGDPVVKGEPLLEIETDKVSMEVEAESGGFLLAITRGEGEAVPVTETIGYIGEKGEPVPQGEERTPASGGTAPSAGGHAPPAEPLPGHAALARRTYAEKPGRIPATPLAKKLARQNRLNLRAATGTGPGGSVRSRDVAAALKVKATPLARRLAGLHGVALTGLSGSGEAGRITKEDVMAAVGVEPTQQGGRAGKEGLPAQPLSQTRRIIAERMALSHREIPPVTLQCEVDVTELLRIREKRNRNRDAKISINDFILRAAARALRDHPSFRASLRSSTLVAHADVHIGMAVALEDGLVVPVIKNADSLSLEQLSDAARHLAEKARSGRLTLDELEGGVFTVTNLGMYGITAFNPIINPPQAAILGVCAVRDALGLDGEKVVVRKKMNLALTIDHRILDGAQGAMFLRQIRELLENPQDDERRGRR
jgi:pyruvate dehydrogenase E2 component (dihydrolipoamide acetyltransferase)